MGSLPRLLRSRSWGNAVALGAGAAILLNTRPFEGGVLLLGCGIWLLAKMPIRNWPRLVPAGALVALCLGWILFYNYSITGSPFKLPYAVHEQQYAVASPFLFFENPRPVPHYFHNAIKGVWACQAVAKRFAEQDLGWVNRWCGCGGACGAGICGLLYGELFGTVGGYGRCHSPYGAGGRFG